MATWIKPASNKEWDEELGLTEDTPTKDTEAIQSGLYLLAAHITRGGAKANRTLYAKLVWDYTELTIKSIRDGITDAEQIGRFAWWLRRIFEAKPYAGRS